MAKLVGIIAEDKSDIKVIETVMRKVADVPFSIQSYSGNGCAKVRSKCDSVSQNLRDRGCNLLVIVHDLDDWNRNELIRTINAALSPSSITQYVVVIPIREIEAWLLADHQAIKRALNLKETIGKIANPESIPRPKEFLRDLIYKKSRHQKTYVNTIHNEKIAQECEVASLRRCASFSVLENFVKANLCHSIAKKKRARRNGV